MHTSVISATQHDGSSRNHWQATEERSRLTSSRYLAAVDYPGRHCNSTRLNRRRARVLAFNVTRRVRGNHVGTPLLVTRCDSAPFPRAYSLPGALVRSFLVANPTRSRQPPLNSDRADSSDSWSDILEQNLHKFKK